jgi:predicted CxxxxCH...CXXCH cytochrome family protein
MKNHHEVGHFKTRLMILLLSLVSVSVMAGESIAATTCSTCHGMPPLDSASGVRIPSTGAVKGNHQAHVSGATASDCVVCHSDASGYNMSHSATSKNVIKLSTSINGGTYSKGVLFNQTSIPTVGNCSNVICHGNVYSTSGGTSPNWGTTGNGCSACHSVLIDTTGPNTGSHAIHATTDCSKCHAGATNNITKPTLHHADGFINVTAGYPKNVTKHAAGTYTGTCSAASCHANVYGTGSATTPVWGSTGNGCSACHSIPIGANGPASGAHNKHAGVACTVCHAAGTTATTAPTLANGHIDGNIDIYYFNYPANVTKHAAGSGYGTCSTASCHSNGKGTYTSPNWGGTSTGCNFCHPTLSGAHSIHVGTLPAEISFYAYTSTKSAGTGYKFGCANCHPLTVANHMNGTVDVDMTASASGGHLKALNGAWTYTSSQCNNIYCHSNGYKPGASYTFVLAPNWLTGSFTGDRCAACHGNSPNSVPASQPGSSAHTAHAVGIHYDDIFNGVSKKLPQSGGTTVNAAHGRNNRSTTINCNICHSVTVATFANDQNPLCSGCHKVGGNPAPLVGNLAVADTSKHVNGVVDVNFINQKISTKAQVAPSAFSAYTAATSGGWSRNKGIYKTYTSGYDVTKSMLSASPVYSAAGCAVACHSNITVKWTDTVTCTSCHTRLK